MHIAGFRLLLILSGILLPLSGHAQSYIWSRNFSGTPDDNVTKMDVDAAGNSYTTGFLVGTTDFDPGPGVYNLSSSGTYNIYVCKLNALGNFQWAFKIGASGLHYADAIAVDPSGNSVFVSGRINGTVDMDPGPGVSNLSGPCAFLAKYNSGGALVWAQAIGTSTHDITVDDSNNVIVTGTFTDSFDFDFSSGVAKLYTGLNGDVNVFLAKYSTTGGYTWAKNISGRNAYGSFFPYEIVADPGGNIYVTGGFWHSPDVDPDTSVVYLNYSGTIFLGAMDIFLVSYTAGGRYRWNVTAGSPSDQDYASGVDVDAGGNVYIGGEYKKTVDFDPGPGTASYTAYAGIGPNGFLASYDSAGRYRWAYDIGTIGHVSSIDANAGNIFVTGYFAGTADLDFSSASASFTTLGGYDIFFCRYDKNAGLIWAKRIGGTSSDEVTTIRKQDNGSIYLSGTFLGTADFDPDAGTANLTSGGMHDPFVAKYSCPAPAAPASVNGPQRVCRGQGKVRYIAAAVSGAQEYTWSLPPGATIDSISKDTVWISFSDQAGNGSIRARANNGCSVGPLSPALSVTVDSIPAAHLSYPSQKLCLNDSMLLESDTTAPGWRYSWKRQQQILPDSTPFLRIYSSARYTLKVYNLCGSREDSAMIYPDSVLAKIYAPEGDSLCPGDTLLLRADTAANRSYLWEWDPSFTDSAFSLKLSQPGIYKLRVQNICGQSRDSIKIRSTAPPASIQGSNIRICPGSSVTLSHTEAMSGYKYQWQHDSTDLPGDTNAQLQTSVPGTYRIKVSKNSCPAFSPVFVLKKDSIDLDILAADTLLCPGDTAILQASVLNGTALSIAWRHNATPLPDTLTVLKAASVGYYKITAKDSFCEVSDSIPVAADTFSPVSIAFTDTFLCPGDTLVLGIDHPASAQLQWHVNSIPLPADTLATLKVSMAGRYVLSAQNSCGSSKDSVNILPAVVPAPLLPDTLISCKLPFRLDAGVNAKHYLWSGGDSAKSIEVNAPGLYTLSAWDHAGCLGSDSTLVVYDSASGLPPIPNVFTPDNDGINDAFSIDIESPASFELIIFNRWGEVVFRSDKAGEGWNGETPHGKAPAGTYFFSLSYSSQCDGKLQKRHGTITLIRN